MKEKCERLVPSCKIVYSLNPCTMISFVSCDPSIDGACRKRKEGLWGEQVGAGIGEIKNPSGGK